MKRKRKNKPWTSYQSAIRINFDEKFDLADLFSKKMKEMEEELYLYFKSREA